VKYVTLLIAVLLAACSSFPRQDSPLTLDSEHPRVEPWPSWQLSGRISVRSGEDGWFAALQWQQTGDQFRLFITGALGQGAVEVIGGAQNVQLRAHDGRVYIHQDAESLIQQVLGVTVPVSGLRYWVHGLTDPTQPSKSRWNQAGVRTELRQAGWVIQFQNYVSVADRFLPTKIRMENTSLQIRLQVDQWQKGSAALYPAEDALAALISYL